MNDRAQNLRTAMRRMTEALGADGISYFYGGSWTELRISAPTDDAAIAIAALFGMPGPTIKRHGDRLWIESREQHGRDVLEVHGPHRDAPPAADAGKVDEEIAALDGATP